MMRCLALKAYLIISLLVGVYILITSPTLDNEIFFHALSLPIKRTFPHYLKFIFSRFLIHDIY